MVKSVPDDNEAIRCSRGSSRRVFVRDWRVWRSIPVDHCGTIRSATEQVVASLADVHQAQTPGLRGVQQFNIRCWRPRRLHGVVQRRTVQPTHQYVEPHCRHDFQTKWSMWSLFPFYISILVNNRYLFYLTVKNLGFQVGLAVVNGQLYAVGGFDGTAYLKTIEVYDTEQNQWRLCGCMNYRRLGGGVGVMRAPQTENCIW